MNNYLQLIPRYLAKQRTRTMLAIFGLVLAVALMSAAGIIGASIRASYLTYTRQASGAHHASFNNLTTDQADFLEDHIKTSRVGRRVTLGRASYPEDGVTIAASYLDETAIELNNLKIQNGTLPQKDNEIALEKWVLQTLGLEPIIGQTLDLTFALLTPKGSEPNLYSARFILTGILENDPISQATGYSEALLSQNALTETNTNSGIGQITAFVEVAEEFPVRPTITELQQSLTLLPKQVVLNESLLLALEGDGTETTAYFFLGLVIMFATAAAIHNIIYISVLERIRQYGLLRSLGTSPRQIRAIVFGEALVLCLISIPLGLLLGWGAAKAITASALYFKSMVTEIVFPSWVFAGTVVFSLVTIVISVWRPARLASRVSPLEALKGMQQESVVNPIRTANAQYLRIFGVSGKLADRNIQRHKKSYTITVVSMSICVILYIVFSSFMSAANPVNVLESQFPGEFVLSTRSVNPQVGYSAEDLAAIKQLRGVEEVYATQTNGVRLTFPFDKLTPEFKEYLQSNLKQNLNDLHVDGLYAATAGITSYSENVYSYNPEALTAGEIDLSAMKEQDKVYIVNSFRRTEGPIPISTLQVGDTLTLQSLTIENGQRIYGEPKTVTIAGVYDHYPFPMEMVTIGVGVIAHPDLFSELTGSTLYHRFDLSLNEHADEEAIESVLQTMAGSVPMGRVISYAEQVRDLEEQKQQFSILASGLIGVVVLISLFSIVNTISTTLLLRTREFGILRAVGLTKSQLTGSLRVEGLSYGLNSAIWGAVLGNILAYLLYVLAKESASYLVWRLPWQATILACAGTIAVGLVATIAPSRRIASLNVSEALRLTT